MTAWYAGPDRHTKQSLTQTNHTRWCINTIRSPDDGHLTLETSREMIWTNKYMKKYIRLVINKNSKKISWKRNRRKIVARRGRFYPLNAELNPICHLLALLGGATIVVVSRLRVKSRELVQPKRKRTHCLLRHSDFSRYTVMHRLTKGIRSEKCVVRRFRCCANVIQCTYTNLDSIAYCTPTLYGIAYCS